MPAYSTKWELYFCSLMSNLAIKIANYWSSYLAVPPPQSSSVAQLHFGSDKQGPAGNCEANAARSSMHTSCIKHNAPVSGFFVALVKSKLTLCTWACPSWSNKNPKRIVFILTLGWLNVNWDDNPWCKSCLICSYSIRTRFHSVKLRLIDLICGALFHAWHVRKTG